MPSGEEDQISPHSRPSSPLSASAPPSTSYPPPPPPRTHSTILPHLENEAVKAVNSLAQTSMLINGGHAPADSREVHGDSPPSSHESELIWSRDGTLTAYLLKLSLVAGCSGLLFGWDTGVASGVLVAIKSDLGHPLSAGEQELIVSATTVGAIVGSLVAGKASDWVGRKKVILIAAFLFLLGSLEQTASNDVPQLVLGRFIVGVAVGQAATVVPMYLAEIAPASLRGRIVGTNSLLITGGQVVAYLVNAALFPVKHGWRWMVLCTAAPALVQLIGLLSLDESPRWLVGRGQFIEARRVLKRIYPLASDDAIERQVDSISDSLKARDDHSSTDAEGGTATQHPIRSAWSKLFREPHHRRALVLAAGLQAFQQATGFNALMYYSSRLLLIAGPPFDRNPTGFAVLIALANFIGTIVAMRFVDSLGRRRLMLWTTAAMGLSLLLLSGSFGMIGGVADVSDGKQSGDDAAPANPWAILTLMLMISFTLFYALGQGIIPWLVLSEVFSGQVRSLGSGIASCANWSVNLFWSAFYLTFVEIVNGPAGTFAVFAVISAFSWLFTWKYLPELKGVSIDEVGRAFGEERRGDGGGETIAATAATAAAMAGEDRDDENEPDDSERRGLLSSSAT